MVVPLITEIQRFSLQDGPGIRTTLFVKGCPLHCPWCHNPETQNSRSELYYHAKRCTHCLRCVAGCPSGASAAGGDNGRPAVLALDRRRCRGCLRCVDTCLCGARETVGQALSSADILRELLADKAFFDNSGGGVTISGGEPLMFPEFTRTLCTALKAQGIHVVIETSACVDTAGLQNVAGAADLFVVDLKSLNPGRHARIVGGPLNRVLNNIEQLLDAPKAVRVHIPLIPGFNDTPEDYREFARYLGPRAGSLDGVDILPYHGYGISKYNSLGRKADPRYNPLEEINPRSVKRLAQQLKTAGIDNLTVGGMVGVRKNTSDGG